MAWAGTLPAVGAKPTCEVGIGKVGLTVAGYATAKPIKPKKKCCKDKPRCKRCPLRALAEGTLPPGYTVKKRRLVKLDKADEVLAKSTRKAA